MMSRMSSLIAFSPAVDSADRRVAATLVHNASLPVTSTDSFLPDWESACLLPPAGKPPQLAAPLDDFGYHGRALICADDIIEGKFRFGCSLIVAPGERLRSANNAIDHRSSWRVAVYVSTKLDPLRSQPELVAERSLAWVVRFLCQNGEYKSRCRTSPDLPDIDAIVVRSVAWIAHNCRDSIAWQLARLRPHLDRQPHPRVVAEVTPLLREQVLDAARVFGQGWVTDVLGEWGHLATLSGDLPRAYLLQGHDELERYLCRATHS